MARSFWKGRIFIKDFIEPSYEKNLITQLKMKYLLSPSAGERSLDEIKIYRRNHSVLPSQQSSLQAVAPYYLYNGYDFVSQIPVNSEFTERNLNLKLNLGGKVTTREIDVVHKIKLSKAARKNRAKLVKKKSLMLNKSGARSSITPKKKSSITKKLK